METEKSSASFSPPLPAPAVLLLFHVHFRHPVLELLGWRTSWAKPRRAKGSKSLSQTQSIITAVILGGSWVRRCAQCSVGVCVYVWIKCDKKYGECLNFKKSITIKQLLQLLLIPLKTLYLSSNTPIALIIFWSSFESLLLCLYSLFTFRSLLRLPWCTDAIQNVYLLWSL